MVPSRRDMAESDGKPASSPLSSEEADRLSENFRPSWETEPEPKTVPKTELEPPTLPKADAPKPEPAKVEPMRIEPVHAEPPKAEPPKAEPPKAEPPKAEPLKVDTKPLMKQTLVGLAVPIPPAPPTAAAPNNAPDDLDWELPTNPAPSPIEELRADEVKPAEGAAAVEPPPKSSPSGVGQTYKPKDADAPAIILTDEVKRAEETARAQLVAEHRARSAPTVLKFKAVDVQPKVAPDDDDDLPDFATPKKKVGVWLGLGAGALSVALIGILVALRGGGSRTAEPPPVETQVAAPAATPEAPPPPASEAPSPPAAEPAPAEPTPAAAASNAPQVTVGEPAVATARPTVKPAAAEPVVAPKPAAAPKAPKPVAVASKPAAPVQKPAAPATKPASPKPASATKPASGGIVRDAPF